MISLLHAAPEPRLGFSRGLTNFAMRSSWETNADAASERADAARTKTGSTMILNGAAPRAGVATTTPRLLRSLNARCRMTNRTGDRALNDG